MRNGKKSTITNEPITYTYYTPNKRSGQYNYLKFCDKILTISYAQCHNAQKEMRQIVYFVASNLDIMRKNNYNIVVFTYQMKG